AAETSWGGGQTPQNPGRSTPTRPAAAASAARLIADSGRATAARSSRRSPRGRCRGLRAAGRRGRADQLEPAVEMLEHGGAALDPVPGVAVEDRADRTQ